MRAVSVVLVAGLVAACNAQPAPVPSATGRSSAAATGAAPTASLDSSNVPDGQLAYMRVDADGVERYFRADSTGENETLLFETRNCACIGWSPDGSQLWSVTDTPNGLRFTTLRGQDRHVYTPDIETLNLAPSFGSVDPKHIVFFGWDETDPSRTGVWIANADFTDLRQVTGVPEGVIGIDPIGMSTDGSHLYFHGDLGENADNEFHHAGNVYVIATDGTGLRQLNPTGTKTEITGEGLAADGRFAFTAWLAGSGPRGNALFVVDAPDGAVHRVTRWTVGLWGASWSPRGDWIGVTQEISGVQVASLIKPDGTGLRPISPPGATEPAFGPVWSPEGTHLLVRRGGQHDNDLWVMDLNGSMVWQVTHKPAAYDIYDWAPELER